MTEMVGLVACSKSKRGEDEPDREFRAEDLYDSWLFDGRARAVKAHCDEWAIFSAKHGYVEPDDPLTWYDRRITDLPPEERRELAQEVVGDLPETDRLMILMGRDYAEPLKAVLPDSIEVWDPLEGVNLFDQRGELRDLAGQTEQATLVPDGGSAKGRETSKTGTERFDPPEFEEVEIEKEKRHNGAPDRFVMCSGGMDSVAMAHYMIEEQWGGEWGAWNKRPVVIFLETTIGLSSQRLYVQLLGRMYGWQVVCWQTHQEFGGYSEDQGFHGPQEHDKIFNVLKQRQVAKAATISANPHVYWGSRVEEKGEKVNRVDFRDEVRAWCHNPIYDWSDQDVVKYLRDRELPFNPNWEASHFTDCGCGATASVEELIELEAEGYEIFSEKLRDLEDRVETGDRRETWAWGSFDPKGRQVLDAQNDPDQTSLSDLVCGPNCSGKSKALTEGSGCNIDTVTERGRSQ